MRPTRRAAVMLLLFGGFDVRGRRVGQTHGHGRRRIDRGRRRGRIDGRGRPSRIGGMRYAVRSCTCTVASFATASLAEVARALSSHGRSLSACRKIEGRPSGKQSAGRFVALGEPSAHVAHRVDDRSRDRRRVFPRSRLRDLGRFETEAACEPGEGAHSHRRDDRIAVQGSCISTFCDVVPAVLVLGGEIEDAPGQGVAQRIEGASWVGTSRRAGARSAPSRRRSARW